MPPKRKAAAKSKATAKEPESTEEEEPKPRRGRARSRGDNTAEAEAEPESKKARTRSSSSEVTEENGENSDADKQVAEKNEPVAEENGKDEAVETEEETAPEKDEEPQPESEPEVSQAPPREKVESAPEVALEPQQEEPAAAMPTPVESQPQQQASLGLAADPTNPAPGGLHDQFYMLLSPDGLSAVIDVHPRKCGAVIGPRGSVIHGMQERSGARIKLNQDYPDGEMRKLTISGTQEQVQMCAELVKRVLEPGGGSHSIHENALSGGDVITEIVMCPPTLVGRVVGRGGGNVREVQSRSGARVQVNQHFPEGQDRQVEVTGTQAAVRAAVELVKFIMENGPVLPAPGMPLTAGAAAGGGAYGPGVSAGGGGAGGVSLAPGTAAVTVECPKACIGRVIGRGGDTVSRIQRETQAKVHIDQNVPEGAPVKVNISGYEAAVHAAIKLVQDIMVNGSAGFSGGGGGVGVGGGYGQQPQQQMGGYGGGGGGGYGQQPQQQMGGYGGGGHGGGGGGYGGQGGARGGGGGYGVHAGSTYGPGGGGQQQYAAQHTGGYGGGGGAPPPRGGPPPGGLPQGWVEYKDQGGTPYFHNAASGATQWERPQ